MKLVLSLVVLTTLTLGFCRDYISDDQEWNMFQNKFNRHYDTIEEYEFRKKVFVNNWHDIKAHNQLYDEGKSTFRMGVNNLTDWTKEEIARLRDFGGPHGVYNL